MPTTISLRLASFVLLALATVFSAAYAGTVKYSYDAAERLAGAEYGGASLNYLYDAAGNLLAVSVTPIAAGSQFSRDYVQKAYVAYYAKVAAGCPYGTEQQGVNAVSGVTAVAATVTAAKAAIAGRCGP